ncbi:hypothetical protein PORY_001083 [Pneumocystis oryctolagi]|uniref:Uncharacterized protein n=1 Tax=Pneumocystis oryctolagi TaxID=42067 RepID=A0ACB7CEM4_9ASCO|nr:hypothetical protein PORY_001083 [Pneumocystis oryctolagi]
MQEVCKELNDKSNELATRCSNAQTTCKALVASAKEKCTALKTEVEKALKEDTLTNEECQPLLEQCYFYGPNCEGDEKEKCEKLKKSCSKQDFTFTPPDQPFNPIEPPVTLAQKIGLTVLYQKAAQDGVYIGSALTLDVLNLLALLTPKSTGKNIDKACKDVLDKNCKTLKTEYPMLSDLCDSSGKASDNGTNACTALKNKLDDLPQKIKARPGLQSSGDAIPWHELSDSLTEEDCKELESECSYFLPHKSNLEKPCKNVRVACYKRGLGAVANEALEDLLRGLFNETNSKPDKLLSELVEKCKKLKTKGELGNDELLSRCLQPDDARLLLLSDLRYKRMTLHFQLNEKRDFPNEKDCIDLERKCEIFGKDFGDFHNPCITLRRRCDVLRQAGDLEALLLVKTEGSLKNGQDCKKEAEKICRKDARLGRNGRSFACANATFTCQTITDSVKTKCHFLGQNIQIRNATTEISSKNTTDEKEDLCDFWEEYCDAYMPHSDTLSNEASGSEGECIKLKKACEAVIIPEQHS